MTDLLKSFLEILFGDGLRQVLTLMTAFAITWLSIPSILALAREKKLYDEPGQRKLHIRNTPTLGGISIFASLAFSILIFGRIPEFPQLQYLIAGLLIIFFIGLKDDILSITPWKKLFGQIIAAFILIVLGQIRITNLQGLFGLYAINPLVSTVISFFVIIVIINSINLIDGIDGLATGLSIVAFVILGTWYYMMGATEYSVVAAAMVGSLVAFFYFNVFSKKSKIFMGDTGSLMIGLVLAAFIIRFNELNIDATTAWHINAAPAVSFGILMIPLFDTLRVFLLRTIRTGNPFKADRNHLHHLLLNLKLSHFDATLTLISVNLVFTFCVFKLQYIGVNWLFILIILAGSLLSYGLHWLVKRRLRLDKELLTDIPIHHYHNLKPIVLLNEQEIAGKHVK